MSSKALVESSATEVTEVVANDDGGVAVSVVGVDEDVGRPVRRNSVPRTAEEKAARNAELERLKIKYANNPDVVILNEEETKASIENELRNSGYTWEELRDQAARGDFDSPDAHRTWFVVADHVPE